MEDWEHVDYIYYVDEDGNLPDGWDEERESDLEFALDYEEIEK